MPYINKNVNPTKNKNKKENKICNKNPLGGTPGIIRDF
jgi:hypothetical protein